MARKNKNAKGRRYHHRAQDKLPPGFIQKKKTGPRPVEQISAQVMPIGKCGRKLTFRREDAPKALKQARRRHLATGAARPETRYYDCDRCGGSHLTSRETYERPTR